MTPIKVWAPDWPTAWELMGNDSTPTAVQRGVHGVLIGVDGDDGIVVLSSEQIARIPLLELQGNYYSLQQVAVA